MADLDNNHVQSGAQRKKERSPSFPFIGLPKALDRARELYQHAKRHEVRIVDVAAAWKTGAKSSGTLQTIGALLAFGLLEDQGSGDARKVKITDLGFRALEDQRPGARDSALREAALRPKLIADYVERWRDGRPADPICLSELRIERGFTEDGARSFLRVFDDTVSFAKGPSSDTAFDKIADAVNAEPLVQEIGVGDFVQWTSNGVEQFKHAQKVVEILPDGKHVRVFGSTTGIPLRDLCVVDAPSLGDRKASITSSGTYGVDNFTSKDDISILLRGRRLEIAANVDGNGLEKLREMLAKYTEILKMLS